jgi:DNA-binding MarR family transcriptional regulator
MMKPKHEQASTVIRAVLSLARRLRHERPHGGIGLAATGYLATLRRLGPLPAHRLASEQGLQPQTLTRVLAALEANGWISRRRSEEDRREVWIELTDQGSAVLEEEVRSRRLWLEQAIAENLTDDECARLLDAAEIMLRLAGSSSHRANRATHPLDERAPFSL